MLLTICHDVNSVAVTFTGFKESTPGFNAAAKERLAKIVTGIRKPQHRLLC